ncbi:MAG: UvrD-helicase domain-containing protein [Oscillospiraceae bacterium]|nr:UvrD-helicase domain-containing protein [Oscillospiraceae bacterium]
MLNEHSKAEFLALRRAAIEKEFSFLNDMQRKAVFKTDGALLLLAGAGSGKTTVVINRIANIVKYGNAYNSDFVSDEITDTDFEILEQYLKTGDEFLRESAEAICALNPAPPWSVLAITFTNKAANELKERLSRAIGERSEEIWASTFHSACVRILRRDIERLGYTSSFTIYDASDAERVVKDVLGELSIDTKAFPPKAVLNIISRAKDRMLSPEKFASEVSGNFREEKIAEVYKAYQARLKSANALDFDDIIMLAVRLLSENPDVLEYYHRKFRYVLVDEYQDTNHAQYLLTSLLAGGRGNICVVGDDDQSIYAFRGATIENILSFEDQFANSEIIRLEQNYRSTTKILNVANSVIKNNAGRKGKNLWTEQDEGSLPVIYRAADERDEAEYIADNILSHRAESGKFSDCAVLYRTNAQSMQLERTFQRSAVPYRIIGGMRFFDRAEIKDILSYLCVIANPTDTLRLRRIINVPARKIGDKTVSTIEQLASREGTYPFDIARRAKSFSELSAAASNALEAFAGMIDELSEKAHELPLSELYDLLLEKSGYTAELIFKNDVEFRGRLENIMEFKSSISEFEKQDGATLTSFLEEISLYTDLDRYNADDDCVTLMTIHSAKGLEFPVVFVCGLEEGLFPSQRSMETEDEIEEERRLFYVASTRAKQVLHMTYAKIRMMFGKTQYGRISRFLKEIPSGLCEEKASPEAESSFDFPYKNESSGFSREASFTTSFSSEAPKKKPAASAFASSIAKSASSDANAPAMSFAVGDRVHHKAFKDGLIVSTSPVGNDILLEIAFDSVGTKRLLFKTASKFLSKK